MYRVKKANGWNRYKVQVRVLFFFWLDVVDLDSLNKGHARLAVAMLNEGGNIA